MATLYRASFESDIIPNGMTIVSGTIHSSIGRTGPNTTAIGNITTNGTNVITTINATLPSSSGVLFSYHSKASMITTASVPCDLVALGPVKFGLQDLNTSRITVDGAVVATQEITQIEDNRWNLIRGSVIGIGTELSSSFEVNGIKINWAGLHAPATLTSISLNSMPGYATYIDDIGINDSVAGLDSDTPSAIQGFVGGLVGDGDIQQWKQNVASLFPKELKHKFQGKFTYIPPSDKIAYVGCEYLNGSGSKNTLTILNVNSDVTESSLNAGFDIDTLTYCDYDGKLYLHGIISSSYGYKTYDPATNSISSETIWTSSFVSGTYKLESVIRTVYIPDTSTMYTFGLVKNPFIEDIQQRSQERDLQIVSYNLREKSTTLSAIRYHVFDNNHVLDSKYRPALDVIYNHIDNRIWLYNSQATENKYTGKLRIINPYSLIAEDSIFISGSTKPNLASSSFCICDSTNTLLLSNYAGQYNANNTLFAVDLTTRTGSIVWDKNVCTPLKKLVYSPARNAVYAFGDVESFLFDPHKMKFYWDNLNNSNKTSSWFKEEYYSSSYFTSGSIIEQLPIYNAVDACYSPKNAAIIVASYDKIFNIQGSLKNSVVNALLNPDSLKAGASGSGDICTIKLAKPSGSFTDDFRYEGINISVSNATSLETSSLTIGIRDSGSNVGVGSNIVTWGNSAGTHVRSVFSKQNSGSAKWSTSEFENVQFYLRAN